MNQCPNCESATAPKFQAGNDWCAPCVGMTLGEQRAERFAPVQKQIIDPH